MILTDREIKLAIEKRMILIDPRPEAPAFSSTGLDLTLDRNIVVFKDPESTGLILDFEHSNFDAQRTFNDTTEKQAIDEKDGYLLTPNSLVLAWTKEYVHLVSYNGIVARVEGKSSLTRFGLGVCITAPTVHAGFSGHILLGMNNYAKVPIRLRAGMRVCQLIFEQTSGMPGKGYPMDFLGVSITETF